MRKSRFTQAQIVEILKETDSGIAIKDLARKHGVSVPTYYNWKSRYGGMAVAETARLRELQAENTELKRLYAEQALEIHALKQAIAKLPAHAVHP
ncbi:transposase family protein [Lysobacter antibioticus]|uniref:transposase n=1 Tax=Lysobacter antibioticus TaxID=84531 RepID=UPI000716FB37|nr:transposase [Lysobacter antibioticus]ALN63783.1 transposase family protein [Lysobacter antibioticus]